jgi:hypothetical protein
MNFGRTFFATLGIGTIIGCSSTATLQPGKPVEQVAGIPDTKRNVQIVVAPTHGEPKQDYRRPVLTETRVCAVWVPEHLDEELDMKVGGHWLYFKVDKARWVMAGQNGPHHIDEPNPPLTHGANAGIPEVSNALKRSFESPNWLVPYRTDDDTTEREMDQREEAGHENPR